MSDTVSSASGPALPTEPQVPVSAPSTQPTPGGAARRQRLGLGLGLGLAAVALLGAGGWYLKSRFGGVSLPLQVGQLPTDTKEILRAPWTFDYLDKFGVERADLPDEARWSRAARLFCGMKADLMSVLVGGGPDADDGLALENRTRVKEALACGRTWAERLGPDASLMQVTYTKGEKSFDSVFVGVRAGAMPEVAWQKSKQDPEAFESTRCLREEAKKPDAEKPAEAGKPTEASDEAGPTCSPLLARLAKAPVWAIGSFAELDAFGKEWSAEGKNKLENAATFERLLAEQGRRGALISRLVPGGKDAMRIASLLSIDEKADKDVQEKVLQLVRDAKAAGVEASSVDGFVAQRLEFVQSGEGDAKDLVEALEKYVKAARSKAKDELEKLTKAQAEKKEPEDEARQARERRKLSNAFERAAAKVRIRALEDASVTREGATVILLVTPKPEDDERESSKNLRAFGLERVRLAAKVVAALASGAEPERATLKELGPDVEATFFPPENVVLKPVLKDEKLKVTIPGAKCFGPGTLSWRAICVDRGTAKVEDAIPKVAEQLRKDGYTVTTGEEGMSWVLAEKGKDSILVGMLPDEKGGIRYELEVNATDRTREKYGRSHPEPPSGGGEPPGIKRGDPF